MHKIKKRISEMLGSKILLRVLGVAILLAVLIFYIVLRSLIYRDSLLAAQTIENNVSVAFSQLDDLTKASENVVYENEDYFMAENNQNQSVGLFQVVKMIKSMKNERSYVEKIAFYRKHGKTVITEDGATTKDIFFQYEYESQDEKNIEFWEGLMSSYSSPAIIGASEYKVPTVNTSENKRIFVIPKMYLVYDVGVLVFINEASFLEHCGLEKYDGELIFSMYNSEGEYILGNNTSPEKIDVGTIANGGKFSLKPFGNYSYVNRFGYEDLIITLERPHAVPHMLCLLYVVALIMILFTILAYILYRRTGKLPITDTAERSVLYSCMHDKTFYEENERIMDAASKGYGAFELCAVICRDVADRQGFSSAMEKLAVRQSEDVRLISRNGNALVLLIKFVAEPEDIQTVVSKKTENIVKICSEYSSTELVCGKTFYNMKDISTAYKRLWDTVQEKGLAGDKKTSIPILSNRFKLQLVEYIAGGKFNQLIESIREEARSAAENGVPNRVFPFYLAHIYFEIAEAFKDDNEFVNSTWKMFFENMEYMRSSFNCDAMVNILQNTFIDVRPHILQNSGGTLKITEVMEFINKNYNHDLYLDSIAEKFSMLPKQFSAFFKNQAGIGFVEYLTRIRIEKAKELLKTTDKSIAEISDEVGYNTKTTFTMAFKKYTGESPGQFREKK